MSLWNSDLTFMESRTEIRNQLAGSSVPISSAVQQHRIYSGGFVTAAAQNIFNI